MSHAWDRHTALYEAILQRYMALYSNIHCYVSAAVYAGSLPCTLNLGIRTGREAQQPVMPPYKKCK